MFNVGNLSEYKKKLYLGVLFSSIFIFLCFCLQNFFPQNEVFFSSGSTLFLINLIKLIIFLFFIPITVGAGILYSKIALILKLDFYKKNNILLKDINLNFLTGFCFISVLGFLFGALNLLNYKMVSILFSIFIIFFFLNINFLKYFSWKVIVPIILLLIFGIYKYINPETWSQDSISWYLYMTNNISFFQDGSHFLNEGHWFIWFLTRGNGVILFWSSITDGDSTRLISVYCLFGSCLFLYDVFKISFKDLNKNKTFNLIFLLSAFLFLLTRASFGEYQKYHIVTLFFLSGFYWFLIKSLNYQKFDYSNPIYLIIAATVLDKTYSAFFLTVIFIAILFFKKSTINFGIFFKDLKQNYKILLFTFFIILGCWSYNWLIAGQIDGYLENYEMLKNQIVFDKYFDQTWLDIRNFNVVVSRALSGSEFYWFNFFNITPIFPYTIWFISLVIIFSNTKIKNFLFFKKVEKSNYNYKKINIVVPLLVYATAIFISFFVGSSVHTQSILRALHFSYFFGYLSFIVVVLIYLEFIYKNNILSLAKKILPISLVVLSIVYIGLFIKFDRASNYKTGLDYNTLTKNRQISYFLGKISVLETVHPNRFDIELCKQINDLLPENSKVLVLTHASNDCRGVPTRKINLFQPNYKNVKLHLNGTPDNSYEKLLQSGFSHFVFIYRDKKLDNLQAIDYHIYYNAFTFKSLIKNFSVYHRGKNFLIITTKKNSNDVLTSKDISLIKLIKNYLDSSKTKKQLILWKKNS